MLVLKIMVFEVFFVFNDVVFGIKRLFGILVKEKFVFCCFFGLIFVVIIV